MGATDQNHKPVASILVRPHIVPGSVLIVLRRIPMWLNARVRSTQLGLVENELVLITQSKIKHKSLGPCWWVYDGTAFRQIPESLGGVNLCKLVKHGKVFSKQDKIERKFAKFEQFFIKTHKIGRK
jgi:hypothetical protein